MPENRRKTASVEPDEDLASLNPEQARDFLVRFLSPDPQGGVLRVFDHRFLLLRPEILVNVQKQLEQTVGQSTKGILYLAGEKSGREGLHTVESLLEGVDVSSANPDTLKRMVDVMALLGWGRCEVTLLDVDARRFALTLVNSPIAEFYGPSKKPVCHLVAGWLAGVGMILLDEQLLCEEVACKAMGRSGCEFQLRPMPFA